MENQYYESLIHYLENAKSAAIAFSGGVDSTFLLVAAKKALGDKVLALTVSTPYIAQWEINEAMEITRSYNIRHDVIDMPIPEKIHTNPPDRCYLCKLELFTFLKKHAEAQGFPLLMDGTNADDTNQYRPGMRALSELHVASPLLELGIGKKTIRALSKTLGLPTWDKPAYACLLTRLPHDHVVSKDELQRIERAESFLIDHGFRAIRVRSHGDLARIETNPELRAELLKEPLATQIHTALRSFGFAYVTIDILGYQSAKQPTSATEEKK